VGEIGGLENATVSRQICVFLVLVDCDFGRRGAAGGGGRGVRRYVAPPDCPSVRLSVVVAISSFSL
jgi:hypothetical protein